MSGDRRVDLALMFHHPQNEKSHHLIDVNHLGVDDVTGGDALRLRFVEQRQRRLPGDGPRILDPRTLRHVRLA